MQSTALRASAASAARLLLLPSAATTPCTSTSCRPQLLQLPSCTSTSTPCTSTSCRPQLSPRVCCCCRCTSLLAAAAATSLAPVKQRLLSTATAGATAGMAAGAEAKPKAPAGGGGSVSERIMPHLLNIYGSCATARDFEIYATHATFEDPLMRAHGVKQIKSAFYTLPKFFGESEIVEYTVQEKATGPGKSEILIDNKQHYKVFGRAVDLASLITLDVEDGKVVRHQDWWDKKPLKNRETVGFPLVGRVAEASRRGAMLLTHVLMGCGKDPTP